MADAIRGKIMNVYSYWAGPMPEWISLCLKTFERQCKKSVFTLLTPDNVDQYTIGLHPRWKELPPGVGTDCLRACLLANHGGMWVDADTVCLKDPIALLTRNVERPGQFLYSRWTDGRAIAGYVYSPTAHPVAIRWYEFVRFALVFAEGIGWGDLGEKALTLILNGIRTRSAWEVPLATFLPINIDQSPTHLFLNTDWRDTLKAETLMFGLNHSWMMDKHKEEMVDKLHTGNTIVHRLLRDTRR